MSKRTLSKAEKLRQFNKAYEKETDIFKKMEIKDEIDKLNGVKHNVCNMENPEDCINCGS